MIRTKGFSQTLGSVIGRTLRREDNRDSDEVVPIAKDVYHVDDAADEVFQQPQGLVVDVQGFPSEPYDTLVLTRYVEHVVVIV